MDPDMRISQPAAGFAVGKPRPQPLGNAVRRGFKAGFELCNRALRTGKGTKQRVRVIGLLGGRPGSWLTTGRFDFVFGIPDWTKPGGFVLFILAT